MTTIEVLQVQPAEAQEAEDLALGCVADPDEGSDTVEWLATKDRNADVIG
ncbi:hypothetical protein ACFP2T_42950 [Plantactinospora solaniradicis]|uniref:Uncharacterized protein n=1 Tax=Plantactinospora solaniradicis TaxID=1723736 RepID=A0ABW1KMT2_9ACTN